MDEFKTCESCAGKGKYTSIGMIETKCLPCEGKGQKPVIEANNDLNKKESKPSNPRFDTSIHRENNKFKRLNNNL